MTSASIRSDICFARSSARLGASAGLGGATSLRATPSMSSSYRRSGSSMSSELPLAERVHGDAVERR